MMLSPFAISLTALRSTIAPALRRPIPVGVPTITGDLTDGSTLTANPGTWTNTPTGYTTQWYRDGAALGAPVVIAAGDPAPTRPYVAADDVGRELTVGVIATNGDGDSVEAISPVRIGLYDPLVYETDFVGTPGTPLKNFEDWLGNGQANDGRLFVGSYLYVDTAINFNTWVSHPADADATLTVEPLRNPGDNTSTSVRNWAIMWSDLSNHISLGTQSNGVNLVQKVAGANTALGSQFSMDNPDETAWRFPIVHDGANRYVQVYRRDPVTGVWAQISSSAAANGGKGFGPINPLLTGTRVAVTGGGANATYPKHTAAMSIEVPYANNITISIASQTISPDDPAKTRVTFAGTFRGAIADLQFLTLVDGVEVMAWTTPTAVTGGTYSIDVDIPLSDGEAFKTYVRDPAFPASATFVTGAASVRSMVGMNVAGVFAPSYYDWKDNTFRDWVDIAEYSITGGAYAGANGETLAQAGFIDRYNRLQAIPTDATQVRVILPWKLTPAGRGDRYLKLPIGQDFTLGGTSGSTVAKNLATGISVITVNGDDGPDQNVLYFDVNLASFTPWTIFSMRKLDDASSEILTDECIAAYAPFSPLRFMDVMSANTEVFWKDFPNRWRSGWSVEAAAELCNRTGNQGWLSFGYVSDTKQPSDADITAFCGLFRALVDDAIPSPFVDAYNEAQWNTRFPGNAYLAQQGIMAGYGTGDGVGETTYTPADFFIITDSQSWANGGTRTTTVAITAGQRFIANVSGYGIFAWLCTADAPIGTAIPAVSNSFFTVISSGELAKPRMAGVVARRYALAATAGDPGVINVQNIQSASAFVGDAYTCAFFSPTGGTGDRLIDVMDGVSSAPYALLTTPNAATILAMTPGATRIAGLAASIANNVPTQIAKFSETKANVNAAFVTAGRAPPKYHHTYETGDHVFVQVTDPTKRAAMAADINAYHLSTECGDSTFDLLTGLAEAGARTVTVFCFGPGNEIPATTTDQQNFAHARAINDTTSARIAADRAAAAIYN